MIEGKFDINSLELMGLDMTKYSDKELGECLKKFTEDNFYLFPKQDYGNKLLNDFMKKFREEMFAN